VKAQILWDAKREKYVLVANGKNLVASKSDGYLTYLVAQQKHSAILKAKVTEAELVTTKPNGGIQITDSQGTPVASVAPSYNINERFDFLEQLITMVMNGSAKSLVISGEGGVGKTYSVLQTLRKAGKVDYNTVMPTIEDLNVVPDDDEPVIEEKVYAQINQSKGDYVVIKGHSSDASLYRILFEHRDRTIIFDDCDSVLKGGSSLDLLKAALDSYDDRWVHWRTEKAGDTDLPSCFKFNGMIIFVTNLPLHRIDEAVRTRCFKVDLSMTKPQRIERMRAVLEHVMPDAELEHKVDALDLLEQNMHLTNDINFRTLMNLIMIRRDPSVADWQKLAIYALIEQ